MAGPNFYSNGIGGSTGATLAKLKPLLIAANDSDQSYSAVRYVHHSGSNSNSGLDRAHPFATMAYALASSGGAANQIYVALAGHRETILYGGGALSQPSENTWIIGEGDGDQMPRFDHQADVTMFGQGATGSGYANIKFGVALPRSSNLHIYAPKGYIQDGSSFVGCQFEFGAEDLATINGFSIDLSLNDTTGKNELIQDCSFRAVSPSGPCIPAIGLTSIVTNQSGVRMDNCTFDGGEYGWTTFALTFASASFGCASFQASRLKLYNGSDINLVSAANPDRYAGSLSFSGWYNVSYSDGTCRVVT